LRSSSQQAIASFWISLKGAWIGRHTPFGSPGVSLGGWTFIGAGA